MDARRAIRAHRDRPDRPDDHAPGAGRRLDRRAVPARRRRRRDRARRACLVDRRALLRRRPAVRLRQRRAPDGRRPRGRPRDEYVLSTKVGRLVRPRDAIPADADVDRQSDGVHDDAYYTDVGDRRVVFDYSGDGVRRSLEESLERLGLSRVDIVYIHDPDDHWDAVMRGAYPALERLRAEGTVRAIGAGMNQSEMLTRFVTETDIDIVMLAGRYTLLDQDALPDLLPRCAERGVAVMVVGVMNSGVLADPAARRAFRLPAGARSGRASGSAGSPRSASATRSRSAPPRSSSRSPTRRSPG